MKTIFHFFCKMICTFFFTQKPVFSVTPHLLHKAAASLFISMVLLIFTHPTYAKQPIEIKCPAQITTKETLANTIPYWHATIQDTTHPWRAVTFYDGDPRDNASLAPDKENKNQSTWQFTSPRERDIYIACGYYRSSIELNQTLAKNITSCTISYDTMTSSEQGLIPKKIICSN